MSVQALLTSLTSASLLCCKFAPGCSLLGSTSMSSSAYSSVTMNDDRESCRYYRQKGGGGEVGRKCCEERNIR